MECLWQTPNPTLKLDFPTVATAPLPFPSSEFQYVQVSYFGSAGCGAEGAPQMVTSIIVNRCYYSNDEDSYTLITFDGW